MKKLILSFIVFITLCSFASENTIDSKITSVKIALNGAQVFREGKIVYPAGISKIVVDDLSPFIKSEGMQASSLGAYKILDVKKIVEYPKPISNTPTKIPKHILAETNRIKDSLFYQGYRLNNLNVKIQIVNDQKNIIKRNRLVTSGSDTIPELKELIVYYQKELFALADQSSKLTIKRDLLQQLITKNDTRLSELLQYDPRLGKPMPKQKAKHQLEVTLYAEKAGQSDIEVSYLVSNAGWYPAYDLRVEETDAPINFTYKGYVYQRTGEDWENVKLSLVTYDDRISTEKPTLHEWVLKYYIPRVYKSKKEVQAYASDYSSQLSNIAQPSMAASEFKSLESIQMNFEEAVEEPIEVIITDKPIVVNNTSESLASFSFDIKLPYSIKSDGEEVLMIINDYKIDAEYTHYIVPKLNTSAFLLASIPDWESLNMLPGKTNLFLGKTYLGNTILNTSTMDDTLNVSLGTDQSIYCTRKKVKDSKKCKIIGSKKYQEITIEIIVKNNKNSKVNMVIEDQIPITMNPEEIAIELLHKNGAKHELSSGKLIWDFELKPQEKKKIKFTYSLKYDKRKKVI